jgi:hypothetical protein
MFGLAGLLLYLLMRYSISTAGWAIALGLSLRRLGDSVD